MSTILLITIIIITIIEYQAYATAIVWNTQHGNTPQAHTCPGMYDTWCRQTSINLRLVHTLRFMKDTYTPFILSAAGKLVVLLGTAAILSAGIWGATQVRAQATAKLQHSPNV